MQSFAAFVQAPPHDSGPATALAIEVSANQLARPSVGQGAVATVVAPPVFVLSFLVPFAFAFVFLGWLILLRKLPFFSFRGR